jgi:hypothetical protein
MAKRLKKHLAGLDLAKPNGAAMDEDLEREVLNFDHASPSAAVGLPRGS